jgi:hypothetical protein
MEVLLALLASFSSLFFVIGHSSLLYFLMMESNVEHLPLRCAILPNPSKGRIVCYLALFCAGVFLYGFFWFAFNLRPSDIINLQNANAWLGFFMTGGAAAMLYLIYFAMRIGRRERRFVFFMKHANALDFKLAGLVGFIITISIYIIRRT